MRLTMRVGEKRVYDMDFSLFPEMVEGETIATLDSVAGVPATGLTITALTHNDKHAQATIESSAAGKYHVLYMVTTNLNSRLIADGDLNVVED